jgi:hypothetical protein
MERAFKAQNLARHEPECPIGCAAYDRHRTWQAAKVKTRIAHTYGVQNISHIVANLLKKK